MGKVGSQSHRAYSKMVHVDLLRSIDEVAILLRVTRASLEKGHKEKTLPFVSVEVGKCLIFYIPSSALKTLRRVEMLGVTKLMKFYKDMYKERLMRLFDEDTDWSKFDLSDYE